MESKQQNKNNKKMGIKLVSGGGAGGLAGILLLGGALATAAFVSTHFIKRKNLFNFNKKSEKSSDVLDKSNLEGDHQGLSFLVPDSSSPLDHHDSSNGTRNTQGDEMGSTQNLILDESLKEDINGGKDQEESPLFDESCIGTEGLSSFQVLDNSYEEVNKKNESFELVVEAKKVDQEVKVTPSEQVVVDDDREIPSNFEEKDGVCVGIGGITVGKNVEVVVAARPNQLVEYESTHEPVEEWRIVENYEELVEAVHAENGMHLSEEHENAANVDGDIICLDGLTTEQNDAETYGQNKDTILLQVEDGSSDLESGNDTSVKVHVISGTVQVKEGNEAIEAVQRDQLTLEDGPEAQEKELNEVDGDTTTNGKCEKADQDAVEDEDEQMQKGEYQELPINDDQEKLVPNKFSSESNSSCLVYGVEVQEFSVPPQDGPLLSESESFKEDNSMEEAALSEEEVRVVEYEPAEQIVHDQIIVENEQSMKSSVKDEIEICNDWSDNGVRIGEEASETVNEDIVQVINYPKTQLSREEDAADNDRHFSSKNGEETVELVQEDIDEVHENPQTHLSEEAKEDEDVNNGSRENYKVAVETVHTDIFEVENGPRTKSSEEEDEEESDDDDDVGKVEESSETTGDSSLESNADAIWPADDTVQELSLRLKELQANDQKAEKTDDEDMTVKMEHQNGYFKSNNHSVKEGEAKLVMASAQKFIVETAALDQPRNMFNLKFWIWSVLVPFLLLMVLWFHVAK